MSLVFINQKLHLHLPESSICLTLANSRLPFTDLNSTPTRLDYDWKQRFHHSMKKFIKQDHALITQQRHPFYKTQLRRELYSKRKAFIDILYRHKTLGITTQKLDFLIHKVYGMIRFIFLLGLIDKILYRYRGGCLVNVSVF